MGRSRDRRYRQEDSGDEGECRRSSHNESRRDRNKSDEERKESHRHRNKSDEERSDDEYERQRRERKERKKLEKQLRKRREADGREHGGDDQAPPQGRHRPSSGLPGAYESSGRHRPLGAGDYQKGPEQRPEQPPQPQYAPYAPPSPYGHGSPAPVSPPTAHGFQRQYQPPPALASYHNQYPPPPGPPPSAGAYPGYALPPPQGVYHGQYPPPPLAGGYQGQYPPPPGPPPSQPVYHGQYPPCAPPPAGGFAGMTGGLGAGLGFHSRPQYATAGTAAGGYRPQAHSTAQEAGEGTGNTCFSGRFSTPSTPSQGGNVLDTFTKGLNQALHGYARTLFPATSSFSNSGQLGQAVEARTGERFESFAPVRNGNAAKWYVDGKDYMFAVSVALERARESIWILDCKLPDGCSGEWMLMSSRVAESRAILASAAETQRTVPIGSSAPGSRGEGRSCQRCSLQGGYPGFDP